jgi:hypothetical protein
MKKEMVELKKELETEFLCLKEFGITDEELEAIYEQCGFKQTRSIKILNIKH